MIIFIILLSLLFSFSVIWLLHQSYKIFKEHRRLNEVSASIPGENGLPFIGQLLRYKNIYDMTDIAYSDFLKFNSPTKAFIGPVLVVCFGEPKQIQTILNSTHTLEKTSQHKFADDFFHEGLITASHDRWKVTRKLLNPTFHQKILETHVNIFLKQSTNLVKQLRSESDKGQFDVSRIVTKNVIGSVSLTMLGFNVNNEDDEIDFFNTIERFTQQLLKRSLNPLLYHDFIYNCTRLKGKYTEAGTKLQTYLSRVLKSKREEIAMNESTLKSDRKTFITKLLEISQSSDIYTEKQLLGEIITMFMAGVDTTSVGICFVLVMLGIHKDIQKRVYLEIVEILGESCKPITYEDLQRMVYLDQVIKEVMRLYPPVPFIVRDVAADLPIGKHTLPRGAKCVISPYVLHRNPDVWSDPEKFNPDRFLPENIERRHPYSYLPFAGGHRTCIGKGYAMLYIKTAIATILQTSEISCDLKQEELKLTSDIVSKLAGGFNIGIYVRHT